MPFILLSPDIVIHRISNYRSPQSSCLCLFNFNNIKIILADWQYNNLSRGT